MEVSFEDGVRKLVLNRPKKKNAIPLEVYQKITDILNNDAINDAVILTIITAKGEYFSSGNDFQSALMNPNVNGPTIVKSMVDAFIKYPKILVAVVNGPAIGIASTFITLCDIVYCSDTATFEIPFVRLGLSLEGCSSLTFSNLIGKSKTSEMLYFNHILTASEAYNLGFVAKIIPSNKLDMFVKSLYKFGKLPIKSVIKNKELLNRWSKNALWKCNQEETEVLEGCLQSDEFINAITSFLDKKSKL